MLGSDNKYIGIISSPLTPKPLQPYNTSQSSSLSHVNQNFHPSTQQSQFNRAVHQSSHVPQNYNQRQNFVRPSYNGSTTTTNRVPPQHAQQQQQPQTQSQQFSSRTDVSNPTSVPSNNLFPGPITTTTKGYSGHKFHKNIDNFQNFVSNGSVSSSSYMKKPSNEVKNLNKKKIVKFIFFLCENSHHLEKNSI